MESRLVHNKLELPSSNDQTGAIQGLLRLQNIYDLNAEDIAEGWVHEDKGERLTVSDLRDLAKVARDNNNYMLSKELLNAALRRPEDVSTRDAGLDLADTHFTVR